jgi:hypothetical protein
MMQYAVLTELTECRVERGVTTGLLLAARCGAVR